MTPLLEHWLWAMAGAVAGTGLTLWIVRRRRGPSGPVFGKEAGTNIGGLMEQQRAWEAFAAHAVPLIQVLAKQMEAVTQQTERAAMDLMVHIRALASPAGDALPDRSASVSRIIMAMQFQDITKQRLDHVAQALEQLRSHLTALLKGPQDEEAKREIAVLQRLEQSYTMEEERRLHATALAPDYLEPVPIESEETETESDSVTLF